MSTSSARPGAGSVCLLALALLSGAGCGAHMRFECPAHGGPEWRELTTAHVILRTDLDAGPAEQMARKLELMHALLVDGLSLGDADLGDRVEVIGLATKEELDDFTGTPAYTGHAQSDGAGGQRILVAGLLFDDQTAVTIAHEMAHILSPHVVPLQPRWFSEGLAAYLSSVGIPDRDGNRAVGRVTWIGYGGKGIPVRELLGWKWTRQEAGHYRSAALLVRYLATEKPEAFAELERRLARGERPAEAWNASFPEWSLERPGGPESLDRLIWARDADLSAPGRPVSAKPDLSVQVRILSPPEVHTVRLTSPWSSSRERQRAEVEEALREDPGHVVALLRKALDTPDQALSLARRAVAAHPEDPRAWSFLSEHLPPSSADEREAALRKAVELAPGRSPRLLALASFLIGRKTEEAEALARGVTQRAPWSSMARGVHAFALAGLGRCDEASADLDRSCALEGEPETAEETQGREKRTLDLQRFCASTLQYQAQAPTRAGDHERALRLLEAAVRADPQHPTAWNERGRTLLRMRRVPEAEASFRRQTEVVPAHDGAWNNLGLALLRQGRPAEAEGALRRQLEISPLDANAHRNLGNTLVELDRPREGVPELETAVRLGPDSAYVLIELGRARLAAGEGAEGLAALERAVAVGGSDPTPRNDAAYALAVADANLDRASAWAESAVKGQLEKLRNLATNEPGVEEAWKAQALLSDLDTLGWVRFRQGRLTDAERLVSVCLRIQHSASEWEHMGELLERKGRREEAIAAHARALATGPQREARRRLGALLPAERIGAAIQAARDEVLRIRILRRDRAPAAAPADVRVLLVLSQNGTVADVLPAFGDLPPGAGALRGARHGLPWPEPGPGRLALLGRYRCAEGICAWLLGDEQVPEGPLPE